MNPILAKRIREKIKEHPLSRERKVCKTAERIIAREFLARSCSGRLARVVGIWFPIGEHSFTSGNLIPTFFAQSYNMGDPDRPIQTETYSLITKSLSHPIRRKILRILSEEKKKYFVELRDSLGIDGGHLTYHLNELGELLAKTEDGAYQLSGLGRTSVSLMRDIEETSKKSHVAEEEVRREPRFRYTPFEQKVLGGSFNIGPDGWYPPQPERKYWVVIDAFFAVVGLHLAIDYYGRVPSIFAIGVIGFVLGSLGAVNSYLRWRGQPGLLERAKGFLFRH